DTYFLPGGEKLHAIVDRRVHHVRPPASDMASADSLRLTWARLRCAVSAMSWLGSEVARVNVAITSTPWQCARAATTSLRTVTLSWPARSINCCRTSSAASIATAISIPRSFVAIDGDESSSINLCWAELSTL